MNRALALCISYIDSSVQDCSNSSGLAMQLPQCCTEPSILAVTEKYSMKFRQQISLQWRYDGLDGISNNQPHDAGNSPVTGKFPTQRPVTRSFDVFFDLRPNKRLSKHWWGWWFETPSRPLWRHCNAIFSYLDGDHYHDRSCYINHNNIQLNLSVTTTSLIKFITCDLFSDVFEWRLEVPIYSC